MSDYWSRVQTRLSRRRMLGATSGVVAGGFALAAVGCGDDDDDDDAGNGITPTATIASGQAPVQSASATATRSTKEGDRVRVGLGSEPTVVDPHQSTGGVDNFYLFQMYNQLYEWDNRGASVPSLAESYEVVPDGTQITFKLRKNVKFHNGDPLTAADVVYSWTRLMSPDTKGTKTPYANVATVEAVDDSTVAFKMKKPDAGFILGGFGGLFIIPKTYTESVGADGFSKNPVGTGAYKFKDRTIGTGANFERNDEYFRGKGGFKTAEMKIVPDSTSRQQMIQVGDIDVMQAVAAEQLRVLKSVSGVKAMIQNSNIDTHYALAIKDYPDVTASDMSKLLRDKRVRQALNHAVDKKALAEKVYTTEMAQPYAVTNPTQPWDIKKSYDYDLKKAKDLLSAAGATNLSIVQYSLGGGRLPGLAPLSAAVASNLRDAGVKVEERTEEYNAWLARLRNDTPPYPDGGMIFSWASTAGYPDPFQGVDSKWTCAARYGQYCESEFDTLINQARTMFNPEERTSTLKKAFELMYDEAPALWLVLLQEAYAIRTGVVENWTPRAGSNPVLRLEDLIPRMTADGPLSGVTVLEVGDGVPVGYAGRVLRCLGADVIKVEDATTPDWVREYGSTFDGHPAACGWMHLNGAKHRALLSGNVTSGLASLMAASDITLVGEGALAHHVEPALGLEQAGLSSVVRIVPAVTTPTGTELHGDESAGAATGLRDVYGMGRPPEGLRFDIAEVNAGAHAAAVGALALFRRATSNEPVRVDVGVYESTFSMIEIAVQTILLSQAFDSSSPDMVGSPLAAPYYCEDGGAVVINIYGRGVWERTCAAMDRPDLADDPRFTETFARYEFGQDLRDLLDEFCARYPRDEVMRRLWGQRIPSAPVLAPAELVANEQVVSRGIVAGDRLGSPYVLNGGRDSLEFVPPQQATALFETLCSGWADIAYREDLDAVHVTVR